MTLQLVCRNWRRVYKLGIMTQTVGPGQTITVCPIPENCAQRYLAYVRSMIRRKTRIYYNRFLE